jgi:16S rRNA (cytidine1402-2'-O)-methyltransferase
VRSSRPRASRKRCAISSARCPRSIVEPPSPLNHDIDRSRSLLEAARAAAGAQQYPRGTLYVVATPIGNLADLSLRAIHVLDIVDAVACEDTRTSATLMSHLGLHKPLVAAHEHNEREAAQGVIERLRRDERVALISDAGTPAVCDPGARLVAAVASAGLRVVPVPGPSAVVTACSVAGAVAADDGFVFAGFLPARGAARRDRLAGLLLERLALVIYESPHRISELADELAAAAPARTITVGRELTKQFETVATMPASELPAWLAADSQRRRGEFVVVLHPLPPAAPQGDALGVDVQRLLAVLLRELPLKQAVALAAEASGAPRNALYEAALRFRSEQGFTERAGEPGPTPD